MIKGGYESPYYILGMKNLCSPILTMAKWCST